MKEPVCIDCWRRENLTFAQRLDPAFNKRGPKYRCPIHREMYEADVPGADRIDGKEAA
ncbi:hypothetical protein GPX89_01075 [Nocardia sp. ET3-3]|uniref:Uncharacterized protein n=1 Tax=Nocardia terrae TaxID=2675851 RepID=A0A7K1UNC1_9NOCA|nr:hypothetical protein [Nocardia terrae]MVU75834.1 hypothetical protein [Nocardia terrae]